MPSYYNYIMLAILLLAASILALTKGFWTALVKMIAVMLAGCAAVQFCLPVGEMIGTAGGYGQVIAIVLVFLGTLTVLILLETRGPKAKNYLPKQVNIIASIALLLLLGAGGFIGIRTVASFNADEQALASGARGVGGAAAEEGAQDAAAAAPAPAAAPAAAGGLSMSEGMAEKLSCGVGSLVVMALFYLLWGWTGSWLCNDANKRNLKSGLVWKLVYALVFPIALMVSFIVSVFLISAGILTAAYLIPTLLYVAVRNRGLDPNEKVLTPTHIAGLLSPKKKKQHQADEWALPIELFGYGSGVSKSERAARGEAIKKLPGCIPLCHFVYGGLKKKAMAMRLEPTGSGANLYYLLDGVWQPVGAQFVKPLSADELRKLTAALKTLLGVQAEEAQSGQPPVRTTGQFYMEYDKKAGKKKKMAASAVLQPKGNDEEILVQFEYLHLRFGTLERLGMTEQRVEQVQNLLNSGQGLVVFSAPPGHGLTTLTNIALSNADRFTRDFVTVEDEQKPYWAIENILKTTYDSSKGETPAKILPDAFFREPRVMVLRDMVNVESLELCCREIENQRLVITTWRAKDSADTIVRMLKTGIDPKLLADSLTAVVSQRLVRILCPLCKDQIPANPEILRRLALSPAFVDCLFRPHVKTGDMRNDPPCVECMDLGFKKRTGIYDVLTITDDVRQAMMTNPTEEAIRLAAAKSGERGFIADGGRLVGWGATSFEELIRCLR